MSDATELFVIAEAGVNHNGNLDLAMQLVDAAAAAGADAVKFQTFRAQSLATRSVPLAAYQSRAIGNEASQFEMLSRLELDAAAHAALAERSAKVGIEFMSTPFDIESVDLLARLGVRRFKVPSGEINNPLLVRAVARTGLPMIVSTGMSTLSDVERALAVIAGQVVAKTAPLTDDEARWSEAGRSVLRARVTLLHCTTEYPAPPESVNLRAMQTMATAFGLRVGYSDHTEGVAISAAAVALGAVVIEKHFTMDRSLPGPDHAASLDARDLAGFVTALRAVRASLGTGEKIPAAVEIPNRAVARRSVVAGKHIREGEILSADNLVLKRPGTGIPANRYDAMLGRKATRAYQPDDLIEE